MSLKDLKPERPQRTAAKVTTATPTETDRKMVNFRCDPERARYLRMLAAHTGRSQQDLMEQGIDLLRENHGEV